MIYKKNQCRPEWHDARIIPATPMAGVWWSTRVWLQQEFYKDTVYNLAANTSYSVYLYIMNTNTLVPVALQRCCPNCSSLLNITIPLLPVLFSLPPSQRRLFPRLHHQHGWWQAVPLYQSLPAIPLYATGYWIIQPAVVANDLAIDDITFARASSIPSNPLPVTGVQSYQPK